MNLKSRFTQHYEKTKEYPQIWLYIAILLSIILLLWRLPLWQVSQYQLNNTMEQATLENQFRTTLAQILGGGAVAIGIYFAWKNVKVAQATLATNQKNAQDNLKLAQEGQITERFTRAIDQLGNPNLEIRLGGIYVLERISKESDEDYWPIMEILTAYIRTNCPSKIENQKGKDTEYEKETNFDGIKKTPVDVQVILDVIKRRKYAGNPKHEDPFVLHLNLRRTDLYNAKLRKFNLEEARFRYTNLEEAHLTDANLKKAHLHGTCFKGAHLHGANFKEADLEEANFKEADLEGANLEGANLDGANLREANLEGANLKYANLEGANLKCANLERVDLKRANFTGTDLEKADLEGADLEGADLEGADLEGADLEGADLEGVNLKKAKNLSTKQLSEVKTLCDAKLDEELEKQLQKEYPALFEKTNE